MRILIVGAGIGGLTAALALARDGHTVEVYEQAAQLAELGAGVQISANGARVLFALGLEPALRKAWCDPEGKEIRLVLRQSPADEPALKQPGKATQVQLFARAEIPVTHVRLTYPGNAHELIARFTPSQT